jgi:hypothetical protein
MPIGSDTCTLNLTVFCASAIKSEVGTTSVFAVGTKAVQPSMSSGPRTSCLESQSSLHLPIALHLQPRSDEHNLLLMNGPDPLGLLRRVAQTVLVEMVYG